MLKTLVISMVALATPGYASMLELTPSNDAVFERKGWFWLNEEPEADWEARLAASPPSIQKIYLRWSPMADRRHDFDFIVCANRKLQGSERSGAAKITISFDVGNPIKFDFPRSSASFYGTRFQDRCFIYAEWEWQSRRWNLFDIETDKRFRPEHLKKLTFERTIHHKFEDDTMETALLPSVEFYINPDFKWWTEESDSVGVKIPITDELIDARMRGEAAYYAKICKNIELLSPIKTPDDADKSTYAKGFTIGWKMAQEMLRTESNRDATCKLLPEVFDIAQSKTPRLFRVKGAR